MPEKKGRQALRGGRGGGQKNAQVKQGLEIQPERDVRAMLQDAQRSFDEESYTSCLVKSEKVVAMGYQLSSDREILKQAVFLGLKAKLQLGRFSEVADGLSGMCTIHPKMDDLKTIEDLAKLSTQLQEQLTQGFHTSQYYLHRSRPRLLKPCMATGDDDAVPYKSMAQLPVDLIPPKSEFVQMITLEFGMNGFLRHALKALCERYNPLAVAEQSDDQEEKKEEKTETMPKKVTLHFTHESAEVVAREVLLGTIYMTVAVYSHPQCPSELRPYAMRLRVLLLLTECSLGIPQYFRTLLNTFLDYLITRSATLDQFNQPFHGSLVNRLTGAQQTTNCPWPVKLIGFYNAMAFSSEEQLQQVRAIWQEWRGSSIDIAKLWYELAATEHPLGATAMDKYEPALQQCNFLRDISYKYRRELEPHQLPASLYDLYTKFDDDTKKEEVIFWARFVSLAIPQGVIDQMNPQPDSTTEDGCFPTTPIPSTVIRSDLQIPTRALDWVNNPVFLRLFPQATYEIDTDATKMWSCPPSPFDAVQHDKFSSVFEALLHAQVISTSNSMLGSPRLELRPHVGWPIECFTDSVAALETANKAKALAAPPPQKYGPPSDPVPHQPVDPDYVKTVNNRVNNLWKGAMCLKVEKCDVKFDIVDCRNAMDATSLVSLILAFTPYLRNNQSCILTQHTPAVDTCNEVNAYADYLRQLLGIRHISKSAKKEAQLKHEQQRLLEQERIKAQQALETQSSDSLLESDNTNAHNNHSNNKKKKGKDKKRNKKGHQQQQSQHHQNTQDDSQTVTTTGSVGANSVSDEGDEATNEQEEKSPVSGSVVVEADEHDDDQPERTETEELWDFIKCYFGLVVRVYNNNAAGTVEGEGLQWINIGIDKRLRVEEDDRWKLFFSRMLCATVLPQAYAKVNRLAAIAARDYPSLATMNTMLAMLNHCYHNHTLSRCAVQALIDGTAPLSLSTAHTRVALKVCARQYLPSLHPMCVYNPMSILPLCPISKYGITLDTYPCGYDNMTDASAYKFDTLPMSILIVTKRAQCRDWFDKIGDTMMRWIIDSVGEVQVIDTFDIICVDAGEITLEMFLPDSEISTEATDKKVVLIHWERCAYLSKPASISELQKLSTKHDRK